MRLSGGAAGVGAVWAVPQAGVHLDGLERAPAPPYSEHSAPKAPGAEAAPHACCKPTKQRSAGVNVKCD